MNIHGLKVDTKKIAQGLYAIIEEREETAIVAFGMIPKWIVDLLEKQLREKVLAEAAHKLCLTGDQLVSTGLVDEHKVTAIVNQISQAVCTDIYAVASERGQMIV